jgi:hypothetical protein
MDQIPLPEAPLWGRIDIPCLTDKDYNYEGNAESYPASQGYEDSTYDEWDLVRPKDSQKWAAFVQRWRYFGFIASVFRYPDESWPKRKDLTRLNDKGERVLDTIGLVDIRTKEVQAENVRRKVQDVQAFFSAIENNAIENKFSTNPKVLSSRLESQLLKPIEGKASLYKYLRVTRTNDPLGCLVIHSIWLLHELVNKIIVCSAWYPQNRREIPQRTNDRSRYNPNSDDPCTKRLLNKGGVLLVLPRRKQQFC